MIFQELRNAASVFFGDLGAWSYDTWSELNEAYFEGRNIPGPIIWGLTPHGFALGLYSPGKNQITLHQSLTKETESCPWGITCLGKEFARHVLLHEMMHQRIDMLYGKIRNGEKGPSHNCQHWADEINRIAPLLGLHHVKAQVVKQRRVNKGENGKFTPDPGFITRREMGSFPHPFFEYEVKWKAESEKYS
jgi:hypothetical protein